MKNHGLFAKIQILIWTALWNAGNGMQTCVTGTTSYFNDPADKQPRSLDALWTGLHYQADARYSTVYVKTCIHLNEYLRDQGGWFEAYRQIVQQLDSTLSKEFYAEAEHVTRKLATLGLIRSTWRCTFAEEMQ